MNDDGGLQWWAEQGQHEAQEWLADKQAQDEYQQWLDQQDGLNEESTQNPKNNRRTF